MADRRLRRTFGAAAVALALSSCAAAPDASTFHGSRIPDPWTVPATELSATHDGSWSVSTRKAPLTLVFFGYTNCPDVCSQEMADITSALVRLPEQQRRDVEVVFVTTDPKRDTVPALERYLGAFDPAYVGVTGSAQELTAMAQAFKAYGQKSGPGGQGTPDSNNPGRSGYLVEHTDYTYAVQAGETTAFWNRDVTAQQLAQDISSLLEE